MIYLNLIFLLSLIYNTFSNNIYIDPVNGEDSEDCITENGVCKTIKYTLEYCGYDWAIRPYSGNYPEDDCSLTKSHMNISVIGSGKSTQISFSNGTLQTVFGFEDATNISLVNFAILNVTYAIASFSNTTNITLSSIWFMQDSFVGSFQTPFIFTLSSNITFNFTELFYVAETVYIFFF